MYLKHGGNLEIQNVVFFQNKRRHRTGYLLEDLLMYLYVMCHTSASVNINLRVAILKCFCVTIYKSYMQMIDVLLVN